MKEIPSAVQTVLASILPQAPRCYYRLKYGMPIPEPDEEKWWQWRRKSGGKCLIDIDQIGRYAWVATTFVGFDLNRGEGDPLLYMTVVNGSRLAGIRYYHTVEEAVEAHEQIVKQLENEYDDDAGVRFESLLRTPARPYTFWQRCGQVLDRGLERIKRWRSS